MDSIPTAAKRIHPLMAAAAVSVIVVCAAATAAITGVLPSSHSAVEPQTATPAYAAQQANGQGGPAPLYAQSAVTQAYAGSAPAAAPAAGYAEQAPIAEQAPAPVHRTTHRVVHHRTEVAQYEQADYAQRQSEPAPRQPNYVAMGTGALIGGLVGNQVGSGNGRKLATVAGIIGGGMLGNEIANRNH